MWSSSVWVNVIKFLIRHTAKFCQVTIVRWWQHSSFDSVKNVNSIWLVSLCPTNKMSERRRKKRKFSMIHMKNQTTDVEAQIQIPKGHTIRHSLWWILSMSNNHGLIVHSRSFKMYCESLLKKCTKSHCGKNWVFNCPLVRLWV